MLFAEVMTYNYKKIKELNYKALDLYPNLKSFLQKDLEVYDIMNAISNDIEINSYNKKELIDYMEQEKEFFCYDIFNWMSADEFIDYCREKFPDIQWGSEIIERYWVR